MFTAEYIRSRLDYNPSTGLFTWKERVIRERYRRFDLSWNTKFAGKRAGSLGKDYYVIHIGPRPIEAHRIAWLIVTGEWPVDHIDHINCQRTDNRFCNLREANATENARNKSVRIDSRSGVKGVQKHSQTGKWRARIRVDGRSLSLGLFDTIEGAASAYKSAAVRHFGEFARAA